MPSEERITRGWSIFVVLSIALLGVMLVPLAASIAIWRFGYSVNSNWAIGVAQIRTALDGASEFLALQGATEGSAPSAETLARVKRYLNGPVSYIRVGPSDAIDASASVAPFLSSGSLVFSGDAVRDESGAPCGRKTADGSWVIDDPRTVAVIGAHWDGLEEPERRAYANRRVYVQVGRDSSKAVIRVGESGYIWAITYAPFPGTRFFEVMHPQLEAMDMTDVPNSSGEPIVVSIGTLSGRVRTLAGTDLYRYDYWWKNPEDRKERRKIVLMRRIPSWGVVLCAGLYEDEYFKPARFAEEMSIFSVGLIGAVTLLFAFLFAGRMSRALKTLADLSRKTAGSRGAVQAYAATGIRELDALGASMHYMEEKVLERESALQRELAEKNTLIEEVHHRVKNNLAVLSGIINLQRGQEPEGGDSKALSLLAARVSSMALVYQQLLGADEYAELSLDEYIAGLLSYHQSAILTGPTRSIVRTERLEKVRVPFDDAVPIGLIANELLSNAYLHGIPSQGPQQIRVELTAGSDSFVLSVEDNGPGIGADSQEKTGLMLVRALCMQIGAEFSITGPESPSSGTKAVLKIPLRL